MMNEQLKVEKSGFDIYTESNVRNKVPASSGFYLLWVRHKNNQWECIYRSRTSNLQHNLLHHLSAEEPNRQIRSKVQKHICGFEWTLANEGE